jgi:hypothetical protein
MQTAFFLSSAKRKVEILELNRPQVRQVTGLLT